MTTETPVAPWLYRSTPHKNGDAVFCIFLALLVGGALGALGVSFGQVDSWEFEKLEERVELLSFDRHSGIKNQADAASAILAIRGRLERLEKAAGLEKDEGSKVK